ncbi:CAP domain-containing protein, partial [Mycobacterium sp.]|uniref:CAP domain-containing protein n=1 Tax=Mycobacterium sp. TaxID=1785 RepID=UPI003C740A69
MKLRAAVCCAQLLAVVVTVGALTGTSTASADNKRLNDGVVANVYTVQHNAGCTNDVKINPRLQLAAQWHTNDVLNNRALSGDIGSDGSTVQDRANVAGYDGNVAETVAINPALAISGIEVINQWYYN